ncbi:hypothetical protein cypCar_00023529 [Cyprinus carpio]|nr:hypothetical protein cypCar_00023529 [Cyprinus carpio]
MPVWTPAEMHHNAVTKVIQGNSHVYEGIPGIITYEYAFKCFEAHNLDDNNIGLKPNSLNCLDGAVCGHATVSNSH